MSGNARQRSNGRFERRNIVLSLLVLFTVVFTFLGLELPTYSRLASPRPQVGEVASREFVAPADITYVSEIRTENARDAAARAVPQIYTAPDTSVARQQLEHLRATLAYITSVRADAFASNEQKISDLAALENINLDQDTAEAILALNDSRWQAVQQEAIVVLEQVMRNTIREDRLEDARRSVPALVSLALPEDQAAIVAELVSAFVAPNSFYSEDLTESARQQARDAVNPVTRIYIAGETVVQRGQVLTETDLEALDEMNLIQAQYDWKDVGSAAILALVTVIFISLYLRTNQELLGELSSVTVILVLYMIFLVGGRMLLPASGVFPYVFPLAAFSLTVTALFGPEPAFIFTIPLSILIAFDFPDAHTLTVYYLLSGLFGVFILGPARRVMAFFGAGAAVAAAGATVILAFRLTDPSVNVFSLATLAGISLLNGIAAASLTLLLQFFLAQLLGMTTALQLMEVSRPDHPLLQFILRSAPGTYQHSLQVANLAEQAADQIGADTLLTRVGALYHDAGKALNPYYFIENQVADNLNPHDDMDPATSAATIIRHVTDGLDLARKHHLPRRIFDFIAEHHGTMLTRYQYAKAVEAAGGDKDAVDPEAFRYPGPRPQSRETAILMLADGSEARVRAERPKDEAELHAVIKDVIENRVTSGELDDTVLTLQDLEDIAHSFTTTLRGIYHPRIEYPKTDKQPEKKPDLSPTQPISVARPAADVSIKPQADPSEPA